MQSPLVQQLLSQMLGQQQPNIAKGGFLGKIALAAALRSQMKQQEQQEQAQKKSLVDVIQPDVPIALGHAFGEQSAQNPRYWGKTMPLADAVNTRREALGSFDSPTLQSMVAKQLFPEPEGTKVVGNELVGERSGKVIYTGKEKPFSPKSPIGKVMGDYNNGLYGEVGSPKAIELRDAAIEAAKKGGVSVTQINSPGAPTTGTQTDLQKRQTELMLLKQDLDRIDINQAAESLTFSGRLKRAGLSLKDKMQMATEEEKQFLARDQNFFGQTEEAFLGIRKVATGAQAVLQELEDLREATISAQGVQSPTQYATSLTRLRTTTNKAIDLTNRLMKEGYDDPLELGAELDRRWPIVKQEMAREEKIEAARRKARSGK